MPDLLTSASFTSTMAARSRARSCLLLLMLWNLPKSLSLRSTTRISSTRLAMSTAASLLQERLASFPSTYDCKLAVVIAGGGGHFLASLAATPGASKVLLDGCLPYNRESMRQYVQSDEMEYCSANAANKASRAALRKALRLSSAVDPKYGHSPLEHQVLSVGVGCTSALRSGAVSGPGKAFVCVTQADGRQTQLALEMSEGQSRFEEDLVVSHAILSAIEWALDESMGVSTVGDEVVSFDRSPDLSDPNDSIRQAAERVLSGEDSCVMLLPWKGSFRRLEHAFLPPMAMVFPGSFNPPHKGHVALTNAALEKSSSSMVFFELSITNPDKPSLEVDDIVSRLEEFWSLDLPPEWGVLLTNAPLFADKMKLLDNLQSTRSFAVQPQLNFCIGTDTLVRIIDPKYYNNSWDEMVETLRSMPCKFVAGGRMAQKGEAGFVSGEEDVARLPEDLRDKFTLLPEFRVDISSTELRRQRSR